MPRVGENVGKSVGGALPGFGDVGATPEIILGAYTNVLPAHQIGDLIFFVNVANRGVQDASFIRLEEMLFAGGSPLFVKISADGASRTLVTGAQYPCAILIMRKAQPGFHTHDSSKFAPLFTDRAPLVLGVAASAMSSAAGMTIVPGTEGRFAIGPGQAGQQSTRAVTYASGTSETKTVIFELEGK